uniref:Uncharacterized protein n=1 Tax=Arundo donax TaxID=35708 RepID=A0A0A9GS32_ARUDO
MPKACHAHFSDLDMGSIIWQSAVCALFRISLTPKEHTR